MFDFLFDYSQFMTRGDCGNWHRWMIILYIVSNLFIWAAYITIPLSIIFAKQDYVMRLLYNNYNTLQLRFAFAGFIFFCGMGHLFDNVLAFAYPTYHFFAIWHAITAGFSWHTVILLIRLRQ